MDERQLQALEDKLGCILVETAMKIISLTNSSIFVLLENRDKRRFYGGESRFCELYRSGELESMPGDAEIHADSNGHFVSFATDHHSPNVNRVKKSPLKKRRIQSDHIIATWPTASAPEPKRRRIATPKSKAWPDHGAVQRAIPLGAIES